MNEVLFKLHIKYLFIGAIHTQVSTDNVIWSFVREVKTQMLCPKQDDIKTNSVLIPSKKRKYRRRISLHRPSAISQPEH